MFIACLIIGWIILMGLFWHFIGRDMIQDNFYFIFVIMVVLITLIPGLIYMSVISLNEQYHYLIDNKCTYTGHQQTDWIPVTISNGQTNTIVMQESTTYYWECNGKVSGFDIGPKQ